MSEPIVYTTTDSATPWTLAKPQVSRYPGTASRLSNQSTSPLRYPGGKAKITQFVGHLLDLNKVSGTYIEPFAGGAGVALNLLYTGKIQTIVINDLDDGVYSFWNTVLTEPEYLIRRIKETPFDYATPDTLPEPAVLQSIWEEHRYRYDVNRYHDMREKAFDFFMLNRANVSGVIKAGPIGGTRQDGKYNISARFNKKTLIDRLELVYRHRDRIKATNFEASHFLALLSQGRICDTSDALVYLDPPYYVQGKHLYNCYATDRIHELVSYQLLENDWNWLLTYDTAPQIYDLYPSEQVQKFEYGIHYSANKKGTFQEYMFAANSLAIESFANVKLVGI